ncbi:MAG: FAD-binding protein, partial [Gammaproteobacteria bacterium]|nr:FAD-binding protein [Gammaproteobacteria bacterium]
MAAVRAADQGLSALVIEKLPALGGTTSLSGGGMWIPNNYKMADEEVEDSFEDALEYMKHATFGQSEEPLMRAFLENCNDMVSFARELGFNFMTLPTGAFCDYYENYPGARTYGRLIFPIPTGAPPAGGFFLGNYLITSLEKAGRERGVEYMVNTAAQRLVLNDEGAVTGVLVEHEGKELRIRARRGVLMATGGFSRNEEMVMAFLRAPIYHPCPPPGDTGDGHRMGMAIGADLRNMNESWGWPVYWDPATESPIPAYSPELGKPGSIVVNRKGERFFDEAGPYARIIRAFQHYDTDGLEYMNVPGFVIVDSIYRMNYPLGGYDPKLPLPKWVSKADTLAELAEQLGIDPAGLEQTVESFNRHAEQGEDPEWHRGASAFDLQTAGDDSRGLVNPCLGPVIEPPFYGAAMWPSVLGTKGGLRINGNGQVRNVWGDSIAGLYATGNCTGSIMGAGYPGGGSTIASGMTVSYIAANHMLDNGSA